MENLHAQIIDYLLTQSWQIGVLAVAIAVVSLAVKNKSAHVRYLLWLIVLAKCLVPPLYTITLAVLPQQQTPEPVVNAAVEIPAVAVMVEAVPTEPVTLPAVPVVTQPLAKPGIVERLAEVTFRQWLAFVWFVGVGVFVLAAVIKALRVNQWLRRERMALSAKLQSGIEKLFAELGVKTVPKVWLVEGIGQPFVWGLMRGSVYLPGNFAKLDNDESRRGVLGHELSHILRFDAAVNLLQIIAQGIFWFHPFVWWANKKIRAEREKCCDEMAIARLGAKAKDYSSAIVNTLIAEHEATLPIPSLAIAGPVKNIEDRIKTIMNPGKKFYKRPSLIAAMAVLVLALIAVPTTLALTARKAKTPEKMDASAEIGRAWGEAVEGVQMRVRPERQTWYEGQTPKFLVDMRNKGTVELKLVLAQGGWEVELDGLWYRAGVGFSGWSPTLLLGPGEEQNDILFYPGVWSKWNINGKPLKFTPGWHTVRLAFGPLTRDRANWRRLRAVSNAVVIEVLPAEADKRDWGEAVAGLQCGLRADKRVWKADEAPKLQAVARNVGERPWPLPRPSELLYLKAAGKIWRWKGPVSGKGIDLKPGEDLDKTTILLSEDWVSPHDSDLRLKLSPGKHTVQLVIIVSDPVPPEAVPGTIPVPKQLRIESNVVVIEVLPTGEKADNVGTKGDAATTLQAELYEVWRQRDRDLAGAEASGLQLLKKYEKPEEQALIYYQLAEIYAQSGQISPSKTVEYAEAGWWYLHDPVKKARLFVFWGDALQLSKGRREAARIYLRGLEFCLRFGLPGEKPELPAVSAHTVDGPPEMVEEYRRRNHIEMAAWKHAKRTRELIEHRQALTGQIVQLYAREPDAFDELRELVMKYLHSEEAAKELIAAAMAYRRNPKVGIPVITRMGPDPNPDADLHWGQAAEGIRVRLRTDTRLWAAGDVPKFKLDVRNDGSHILLLTSAPDCWGIEVDGVWYKAAIPMLGGAKGMSFGPDKRWYDLSLSLDMALGGRSKNGGLELTPGRHTVRATLAKAPSGDGVMVPVGAVSNPVKIEILPEERQMKSRAESAEKLKGLGRALIVYANDDEEGRFPDTLEELHQGDYVSEKDLEWLLENIGYLGKGKTATDSPGTAIAYDKALLRKGKGTNVLFLDGHVAFERPEQLEKLGIAGELAWGTAIEGLRCRWFAPVKEVRAEAAAMVGMEIENVSGQEIFWQCREGTWLIRHPRAAPGIPAGTSPRFEVSLGEGVREATTEEAQRHHEGSGSAIGYYVLGPGAKMIITAAYPYPLAESGAVKVEGFLHRENPGGGGAYFTGQVLRNVMTCPPLVLEIVGGVKKPVIEGLSVSVACAENRVETADELELVVSIENNSGGGLDLDHSGLEDNFPIVALDMASQESGPHFLCTKEGGWYGTGHVRKALKDNESKSKTIHVSDCWRLYGGRPILSPGRYRVKAKVGSLTAAEQLVETESEPIWVTILEWPWGEALRGVQVRLRTDKAMFGAGEPVTLKADVYNGGKKEVRGRYNKYGICRLQFDNERYLWGGGPVLGPPIKPGGQVNDIPIPLDNVWVGENKLNLSPGKHVIRVYFVPQGKDDRGLSALVLSNPVEITIIADEAADETGTAAAMGVYKQLDEIVELSGWKPEMSFGDAIEELKNSVEPLLKIVVLWGDLAENADIDQSTSINIGPLPPVRLSYGLELLLKSVSGGKVELGYIVEDGVITIATVDSLPSRLETQVYDIALLVGPPLPGGYGTTSSGIYKPSAETIEKVDKRAKEVAKLIEEFIEPNSWSGAGGEGVIKLYENRKLIVWQTREVHQKIEKLLNNMRRPGLGEAGIPRDGGIMPWWQAERAGKPNSAVQIEGRFILVPTDANEMGKFLEELADLEVTPIGAEPNVKHYLLGEKERGQLLEKLREGEPNCSMMLAAPKVTVLSGESAALSIQTQTVVALPPAVISKILPKAGAKCRTFSPTIPTGTTLSITPIISADKKDILLNLNVEITNFLGMKTCILMTPLAGTAAEYKQEVPLIETVSLQTRVSIPDGATLLLAGQKVKSKGEQDGQIVEKDLLILVKAEIVKVSWIDSNASPSGGGYFYPAAPPVKSKEPNSPDVNSARRR